MEILEGMVRDAGYQDEHCIYGKVDDNTLYYFIKDYKLANGNIIATTNLKEAIGHASYTKLGIINPEGKVLIPFENKLIKNIDNNLLLVERNIPTTDSVVSAFKNKSDPFAVQTLSESANTIKQQMKDIMGLSSEFIFDNQFSEAAIFTTDGVNVANNYFSFIGKSNGDYYLATNVVGGTIMKFNPNQLEQQENDNSINNMGSLTDSTSTEQQPTVEDENNEDSKQKNDFIPDIGMSKIDDVENPKDNLSSGSLVSHTQTDSGVENEEIFNNDGEIKLNISNQDKEKDEEKDEEKDLLNDESIDDNNSEQTDSQANEESMFSSDRDELQDTEKSDFDKKPEMQKEVKEDFDTDLDEFEAKEKFDTTDRKTYRLTDEDIATPTIKDAINTIKNLMKENRNCRNLNSKQAGNIEVLEGEIANLKGKIEILEVTGASNELELNDIRKERDKYRADYNELIQKNMKLEGTVTRLTEIVETLESQNKDMRNQLTGLKGLSDVINTANALVVPEDTIASSTIEPVTSKPIIDIDNYLNRSYSNKDSNITEFNYLGDDSADQKEDNYQKQKAA